MRIFISIFCLSINYIGLSQLQLEYNNTLVTNGDTIWQVYEGEEMPIILYTDLIVRNSNTQTQQVIVRADQSGLYPGTQVQMCWANNCYGPLYTETPDAETMLTNTTAGFQAKYFPNDLNHGISNVRYTFIDPSLPEDSISVIAHYEMHSILGTISIADIAHYSTNPGGIWFNQPQTGVVCDSSGKIIAVFSAEKQLNLLSGKPFFIRTESGLTINYFRYAP